VQGSARDCKLVEGAGSLIFSQFWEAAGSRPARSRQFETCHLDWHRIPEPFGRQKVTDWIYSRYAHFWRASGSATRRPNEAIILGSRCRAEVLPSPSRYRLMQ
jgi:hypothetical protein